MGCNGGKCPQKGLQSAPLLLAPAKGLGALQALLGAFSPLLSSSIKSTPQDRHPDTLNIKIHLQMAEIIV